MVFIYTYMHLISGIEEDKHAVEIPLTVVKVIAFSFHFGKTYFSGCSSNTTNNDNSCRIEEI